MITADEARKLMTFESKLNRALENIEALIRKVAGHKQHQEILFPLSDRNIIEAVIPHLCSVGYETGTQIVEIANTSGPDLEGSYQEYIELSIKWIAPKVGG